MYKTGEYNPDDSRPDERRPWMDLQPASEFAADSAADAASAAGTSPPGGELESRRHFLKLLGVGTAASLAACGRLPVKEAIPLLIPAEEMTPGVPTLYASTCQACPAACGLMVTVRDGRPVKLEGDPRHPLSKGGLCAIGQGELRGLYDAERLRAPTIGGRIVGWPELDRHVAEGLARVRQGGRELALLTPVVVSPTGRAAMASFVAATGARWVEVQPRSSGAAAATAAWATVTGRRQLPSWDLAATDLWISLGSDLLGAGPEPVAHTAAWAARRRAAAERGLLRHIQIEGSLTLTGANADERIPLRAGERRLLALWLLRRLAEAGHGVDGPAIAGQLADLPPAPIESARLDALVEALTTSGRHALVTSGSDDLAEQIAVVAINQALRNLGTTVLPDRPSRVDGGDPAGMRRLVDDLVGGRVGGLIAIDCDPVAWEPQGEALAAAIAGLELSVVCAERPTATAKAAVAVAAAHHSLERWADLEPRPGLRTLAQPSIRPLHDTRDPFAAVLTWSGSGGNSGGHRTVDYRAHLQASWRAHARALAGLVGGWTGLWQRTVQGAALDNPSAYDFPAADAALPAASGDTAAAIGDAAVLAVPVVDLRSHLADARQTPAELEVELVTEVGVGDGSRAHIPWLRELPDPLTRAAWTACVRVAPARASALGLRDGDVVGISTDGGRVELPVRILPGQHPAVLGVPVGYGLAAGDPANWNGYRLQLVAPTGLRGAGIDARLEPLGRKQRLPLMQVESTTHGRPILHQLASLDERPALPHVPKADLWADRPVSSPHWEMVINLDTCTGCSACVVACQAENNIPVVGPDNMARHRDMHWLRLDRYFLGDSAEPDVLFEPMLCAQCDNAPCETVCPVAATVHSEDGLNQQVYNRCVGTRYCANNCPYKVRRFNWFDFAPSDALERMVLNPEVVVRSRGVMEKCTFCVQRIQAARITARKDGAATYSATTACQQSCPAQAIHFGDGTDPNGDVARLQHSPAAFQVLAELGVAPSVTYLARYRNRPGAGTGGGHGAGHGADPDGHGAGHGAGHAADGDATAGDATAGDAATRPGSNPVTTKGRAVDA